jgi:hypothetical protein
MNSFVLIVHLLENVILGLQSGICLCFTHNTTWLEVNNTILLVNIYVVLQDCLKHHRN